MTLEELREACAKVAWRHAAIASSNAERFSGQAQEFAVQREEMASRIENEIRAIPLPAPVDDEFAGHTPGPWRAELLRVRDMLDEFNDRSKSESACVLEMTKTMRDMRQERDEARALVAAQDEMLKQSAQREEALTRERDEARYLLSALHARVSDGHLHTALRAEHSCTAEALDKLRAEVATLTKERDEARAEADELRLQSDDETARASRAAYLASAPNTCAVHFGARVKCGQCADSEVAGLTAALAAAQRERDEALIELANVRAVLALDAVQWGNHDGARPCCPTCGASLANEHIHGCPIGIELAKARP